MANEKNEPAKPVAKVEKTVVKLVATDVRDAKPTSFPIAQANKLLSAKRVFHKLADDAFEWNGKELTKK